MIRYVCVYQFEFMDLEWYWGGGGKEWLHRSHNCFNCLIFAFCPLIAEHFRWACSRLVHWRHACRPRFIERIRFVCSVIITNLFWEFLCKRFFLGHRRWWSVWIRWNREKTGTADEICRRWTQRWMPPLLNSLVWWGHNSKAIAKQPPTASLSTFRHRLGLWGTSHCLASVHLGWLLVISQREHNFKMLEH